MGRQKGEQFHRSNLPLSRTIAPWGDRYADGTPENPFCPESAAQLGKGSAWEQAVESMGLPENETDQDRTRIVNIRSGIYPPMNFRIPEAGSWTFTREGTVVLPAGTLVRRAMSPAVYGSFGFPSIVTFDGSGILVFDDGDVELWDTGARPGGVLYFFERVFFERLTQGGNSIASNTQIDLRECSLDGALPDGSINMPEATLSTLIRNNFFRQVTAEAIQYAEACYFEDDIEVSDPPSGNLNGFFNCKILGQFTGPAGSAQFDNTTQSLFGGGLLGGASEDDFIDSDYIYMFFDGGKDLASSTTTTWYGMIPTAGKLVEASAMIKTAASSVGTILATANVEGTSIFDPTPVDVESLVAGAWTPVGLDSGALDVARGDSIEIDVATGAALVGGTGLRWLIKMLVE
jgi:hypothetical protein